MVPGEKDQILCLNKINRYFMIFFIKYGIERTPIDIGDYIVKCPSCETDQWAEIMVSSVYSHVFYIPFVPTEKDAVVLCKKCGLKRYGVPFDAKLISDYHEIKKIFHHPWFTYTGIGVITLPFLFALIYFIIESITK